MKLNIGDYLDLDEEKSYIRSDGSVIMTVNVDRLVEAVRKETQEIIRKHKKGHNEERTKANLKLRYQTRQNGSVSGLELYCEPNSGHGYRPIATFHPEFVDVIANAERIVELWNRQSPSGVEG